MTKPMPKPEENRLILLAQAGDTSARNELILYNMGCIFNLTARAIGKSKRVEEYLAVAIEAFDRGIQKFDTSRDIRLLTYAGLAVERSLWRELNAFRTTVGGPKKPLPQSRRPVVKRLYNRKGDAYPMESKCTSPLDLLIQEEEREIFERIERGYLQDLTPTHRTILYGHMSGRNSRVVAQEMGVSSQYVRNVKKNLRTMIVESIEAACVQGETA